MKTFLILFVLLFSSSVVAEYGDTYLCNTIQISEMTEKGINSNLELISVVVTTYNRKCYLESAVKSILSQSYNNIELIIVDNCSNYDFFNYIDMFYREIAII